MEPWGWNPHTFEAVGTTLAAVVAATALALAAWQQRLALLDRRRDQARWITVQRVMRRGNPKMAGMKLLVANASPSPVTGLRLVVRYREHVFGLLGGRDSVLGLPITGTVVTSASWFRRQSRCVVIAEVGWESLNATTSRTYHLWNDLGGPRPVLVGVSFVDVNGKRWTRSVEGDLFPGQTLPAPPEFDEF